MAQQIENGSDVIDIEFREVGSSATSRRSEGKQKSLQMVKWGSYVILALFILYGIKVVRDTWWPTGKKTSPAVAVAPNATPDPAPLFREAWNGHNLLPVSGTQYMASRWERLEIDGTVPKGATTIVRFPPGGCRVGYDIPNGYVVRVGNGSDRKWVVAEPNKRDYILDRIQYEATEEGLTPPRITVTCP